MKVEITRYGSQEIETQGKLVVLNEAGAVVFTCDTLELADKNNANEISCIPEGSYICKKIPATLKINYPHIAVTNVANRAGIAMHIANFASGKKIELKGCIAIGMGYRDLDGNGTNDITYSTTTFKHFMSVVPDEFITNIKR